MSARSRNTLPFIAVIIAAITWGFSFLFTKDALKLLEPFQLLGYRFLVAAVLMAVLAACGAIKLRLTAIKLKGMLLVAALQPVLYFLGETFGVKLTSATESGIVIALVPVAITICSVFLLKERLFITSWIAISVSVAGVMLVALAMNGGNSGNDKMVGVLALLGAVAAAGFYNPLSRKVSRESTPMEITFVMMWVGAVVFNAVGIVAHPGGLASYFSLFGNTTVLAQIAYLGILSSVVAFFCLNYALSRLESSVVGTFINLVPIITVFAGVFFAGETLQPLQCAGAALALAGIWWMARMQAAAARADLPAQAD